MVDGASAWPVAGAYSRYWEPYLFIYCAFQNS